MIMRRPTVSPSTGSKKTDYKLLEYLKKALKQKSLPPPEGKKAFKA
jgi:hypothetical protein